jgi:hypothetical protein
MMVVFFAGGLGLLLLNDTHPVSANGISTVARVRCTLDFLQDAGKSKSMANAGFIMSNYPQVWRIYRLLLTGSYDPQTLRLSNPRFRIRPGREALGFLNELTEATDPHSVSLLILEDLVCRIAHGPILGPKGKLHNSTLSRYAPRSAVSPPLTFGEWIRGSYFRPRP